MRKSLSIIRIMKTIVAVASLFILSGATAIAAPIQWNTWTFPTTGTMGGVTVTYMPGGPVDNLITGYPSYLPATSFADGVIVDNAPTSTNNILQITGGNNNLNSIHFSTPVVDPVMAIWSLGQNLPNSIINTAFVFNSPATPTWVAGGPSAEYGGSSIKVLGNTVSGLEGNGTVQFLGTFSDISWYNPVSEYWYGMDVGAPVPEPGTIMLLGAGFLGLAIYGKRRKNNLG